MRSVAALNTQVVSELAASLEGSVWVTLQMDVSGYHFCHSTNTYSVVALGGLGLMLVGGMPTLSSEIFS